MAKKYFGTDGVYVAAVAVAFVGVEPAFDEAFAL